MTDIVNHPPHYTQGGIECLDAIEASMGQDEFLGFLKGNCLKYLWRWRDKGGANDLRKAMFYLKRMESKASEIEAVRAKQFDDAVQTATGDAPAVSGEPSPDDFAFRVATRSDGSRYIYATTPMHIEHNMNTGSSW